MNHITPQARERFYFVEDIMAMLGYSRGKSYEIIRKMNAELKKSGKEVFAGRVPRAYFDKKVNI